MQNINKKVFYATTFCLLLLSVFFAIGLNAGANSSDEYEKIEDNLSQVSYTNINSKSIPEYIINKAESYHPKMSITLDSNFILNVYIPEENTLSFTFDGIFYDNLCYYENVVTVGEKKYYKASKELPAAEAASEISLEVNTDFDGYSLTGSFTFSIPKYATLVLASNSSEIEKTLVKDALSYIGSAYSYFDKENAESVSQAISEIIGSYKGKHAISSKDATATPELNGAAFVLGAEPGIKFYIDSESTKSSYAFYANNQKINNVTEGIDNNGRYLLVSMHAYKMCGAIYYTVDGENAGSYGIHNYYSYVSKKAYTDTKKEDLRDLLRKFYNYSMSAADYYVDVYSTNEILDSIDLDNYAIIYHENADLSLIEKAESLSLAIKEFHGITIPVLSNESQPNDKKAIFVGNSSLIPPDICVKLSMEDAEDAFIIDFSKKNAAIFGKSEKSSLRAIDYFIENYINSSNNGIITLQEGNSVIKPFITLENGSEIVVETVSTVFEVTPGTYYGGIYPSRLSKSYYPSVIELQYNGKNNGKLIAILAVNDTPTSAYKDLDTNSCVMESSDGGKTWKMIARPQETINPVYTADDGTEYAIQGISMAHIYELPTQVGNMPAGTLLYSGTSVNYDCYSQIAIWRSFDCGYTWEEFTVLDSAGGTREGVWEPFTWYEKSDGYLYCFYSDDSDPLHDQKIVYKRSKDGVSWSEKFEVCSFKKQTDRPGMMIMTQMDSGEYLMVYEYYGSYGGQVFYKITDDISDWNPTSSGTLLKAPNGYTVKGGPACIWTPAGSKNGIIIASGKEDYDGGQQHLLFVSFDYGESWTTMENPLPYDITLDSKDTNRIGHSPVFIVGADPSVIYYLNTTVNAENGFQRVEFAKLRIY